MRYCFVLLLSSMLPVFTGTGLAQTLDAEPAIEQAADGNSAIDEATSTPSDEIDHLFKTLREAQNEVAGQRIAGRIEQRWRYAAGETAQLILSRADEAISKEDFTLARDLLDQLIALHPKFAEAWNKRATLHYRQNEYGNALADIAVVLELEPRHYTALTGLGLILQELDQYEQAYDALTQALYLNPFQDEVRTQMLALERQALGQEI